MRRSSRGVVVDFAELSDPGRDPGKQINEDSVGNAETELGLLFTVCDGMGGHTGGQQASQTAVATIIEQLSAAPSDAEPGPVLGASVEAAGRAVFAVGGDSPTETRPGSTCVAVLLHDGVAEIAHVGDSRVYLLRGPGIHRVTRDHSMVQEMVDAGVLSLEEAVDHPDSNRITRALGMTPDVDVELRPTPLALRKDDILLLCSDGLTDLVGDAELQQIIQTNRASGPDALCQRLVDLANHRGGHDNITTQLISIVETPGHDADPTYVEPGGTLPGDTVEAPVRGARSALATVPDVPAAAREPQPTEPGGGPSPTLVEEPLAERTTQPGPAQPEQPPPTARFPDAEPDDNLAAKPPGRGLFMTAAVIAGLVLGAVVLWWLVGSLLGSEPAEPPPPVAEPTPTPQGPTVTELEPDPEPPPEPQPSATPDAATEIPPPGPDAQPADAAAAPPVLQSPEAGFP